MSEVAGALKDLLHATPYVFMWYGIFAVLERIAPAVQHKPIRAWIFNLSVAIPYMIAGALSGLVGGVIGGRLSQHFHGGLIDMTLPSSTGLASGLAASLLSILVFDAFYYWWHRWEHRFPALWAIHKLHHMDEGVNVSTNLRHHWLEDWGRIPVIAIPLAILFKLSPGSGAAIGFVISGWTYFIHANLRLGLGPISWLFSGPQVHRIHHSRLPEHLDKNFSAFFPVWDVLFGTYHHPRRGEFPPTGVGGEPDAVPLRKAMVLPFLDWWQALGARRDSAREHG